MQAILMMTEGMEGTSARELVTRGPTEYRGCKVVLYLDIPSSSLPYLPKFRQVHILQRRIKKLFRCSTQEQESVDDTRVTGREREY